jgi:hypothetical protein
MNIVPIAGDGDGQNENGDDDEANVFQPQVSRNIFGVKFTLAAFFWTAACHRIILAESQSGSSVADDHDIDSPV